MKLGEGIFPDNLENKKEDEVDSANKLFTYTMRKDSAMLRDHQF